MRHWTFPPEDVATQFKVGGSAERRLSVIQCADARVAHSKWMQRERGGRPSDRFDHLTDEYEAEASFF